jgi:membrane associated rhomboid family serine protease
MDAAVRGSASGLAALAAPTPLTLLRLGANASDFNVGHGEWWRLLTAIFLHIGVVHLLFNGWALVQLAPFCERMYGPARFLTIYLFAGLAGNIVSYIWHVRIQGEPWLQAGASGALCGMLGLLMTFRRDEGWDAGAEAIRRMTWQWLIYTVLFGILVGADNAAHLGGAAAGALLGLLLGNRSIRRGPAWTRFVWRPAAAVLSVLAIASFGAMAAGQRHWSAAAAVVAADDEFGRLVSILSADMTGVKDEAERESLRRIFDRFASRRLPEPEPAATRDAVVKAGLEYLRDSEGPAGAALEIAVRRYASARSAYAAKHRRRLGYMEAARHMRGP